MHHGLANAVMLKAAMEFNFYSSQDRFLAMARAVEPTATKGESFVDWFVALRGECGLPAGLKSAGVDESHLEALVAVALADGCHPSNPIPVNAQNFRDIFTEAFKS
jgi:alcohol dehydrogenase class IV